MSALPGTSIRFHLIALIALGFAAAPAVAASSESGDHYVFGWPFLADEDMQPRGGTTKGPAVTLVQEPTEAFERLQEPGLSRHERDRRAILAMAGGFRVGFDFLEVMGYAPDYEPTRPYQSWATEYIYVLTDEPDHIVLQHMLVMRVVDEEGTVQGPFVQKHWRQEWRRGAEAAHVYRGQRTWQRRELPAEGNEHTWLQTVWQVDDAPRYAARGQWRHDGDRSIWTSGTTWRPLPRREHSVRDDYDALVGTNRRTILPTGWVHEQRNHKVVLSGPGEIDHRLATEYGIARYERIRDHDFSAGDAYLEATADFWRIVRDYWDELLAANERIRLHAEVDGRSLFQPLFERAQRIADGDDPGTAAHERFVRETINRWIADAPQDDSGY